MSSLGRSFHYISDLHLEKGLGGDYAKYFLASLRSFSLAEDDKRREKILLVLGDVITAPSPQHPHLGSLRSLLRSVSREFDRAFFVPGNHEKRDGADMPELFSSLGVSNLELLDRRVVRLSSGLRLLGATLWTPKANPLEHERDAVFLRQALAQARAENSRCIVATHYPPSMRLIPSRFQGENFVSQYPMYYSQVDELIAQPVSAWLFGHTHAKASACLDGVFCGLNACPVQDERAEELSGKELPNARR